MNDFKAGLNSDNEQPIKSDYLMADNAKILTSKDCIYAVLCKLPDGKVFTVAIEQELLVATISAICPGKLILIEPEIKGVDLFVNNPKLLK